VTCSVGTYVRVLLSDLAERLGTLGHLSALRREASGSHEVRDAWTLEALGVALDEGSSVLRPPVAFVEELPQLRVDAETIARLRQGQRVELDVTGGGEVAILNDEGDLVAIVVARGALFKPEVVMPADSTKR
ncbi:MAG TPA: tRNA pseudouridine(55) synthase TruB, partial [Acidimicrobiales bacterium]|nr:tRNA pseudouridine(55) synthase TruB [Acidimicrobiales bacterium]